MRIDVGSCHLKIVEGGVGTTVVLLHGFPLSSAIWEPIRPALEPVCRLLTPDLRGFGGSDAPEGDYSMAALAADVSRALEVLGVERYVLGGHSMGGYVALRLLAMHPERVQGLVLIDSKASDDSEEGKRRRAAAVDMIRVLGGAAYLKDFVPVLLGETSKRLRPSLLGQIAEICEMAPEHVLVGCQQGMASRPDGTELLRFLEVPLLILLGEEDPLLTLEAAEAMAGLARRCRLVVIPAAGHTPSLEQPEATGEALLSFFRATGLVAAGAAPGSGPAGRGPSTC